MCAKRVIFGIFLGKRGSEGGMLGPQSRQKTTYLRAGRMGAGTEGILGLESDIMPEVSGTRKSP